MPGPYREAGAYRDLSDGFQFAGRLTSDLRAVSHDGHLAIGFQPFKTPSPSQPTAQQVAQMRIQQESSNRGFEKAEILPGDIGYVKFNEFMPQNGYVGTIEAAMAFVAHIRALIHGAAAATIDAPYLQINAERTAGEVSDPSLASIVPAALHPGAVSAGRFFDRRRSTMIRACGSPNTPCTVGSGRNPGNAYASHSRRHLFDLAIRSSCQIRRPHEVPETP